MNRDQAMPAYLPETLTSLGLIGVALWGVTIGPVGWLIVSGTAMALLCEFLFAPLE